MDDALRSVLRVMFQAVQRDGGVPAGTREPLEVAPASLLPTFAGFSPTLNSCHHHVSRHC